MADQKTDSEKELQVREMRDRVYGQKISDDSWKKVREDWMRPSEIAWLKGWCK